MAITTSFKQRCPSCQAMVTIREGSLIGKKVDCPKCKYKFVVEDPAAQDKQAVADELKLEGEEQGKASPNGKSTTATKKRTRPAQGEDEEVGALGDAEMQALIKKKKASKTTRDDPEEKKPKKAGNQRLTMGLALAGVGLVVLVTAAIIMLSGSKPAPQPGPGPGPIVKNPDDKTGDPDEGKKDKSTQDPKDLVPIPRDGSLGLAGAEFSNLLPPDTFHVDNFFFNNLFAAHNLLRDSVTLTPGALRKEDFVQHLGFHLLSMDRLIRSVGPSGSLSAVHLTEKVNLAALKTALNLEPAGAAIKNQEYFKSTKPNPWFDTLAQVSIGVPRAFQEFRPLFVRIHNDQTIIFADERPMLAFLEAEGQFPYQSEKGKSRPAPDTKLPSLDTPPKKAPPKTGQGGGGPPKIGSGPAGKVGPSLGGGGDDPSKVSDPKKKDPKLDPKAGGGKPKQAPTTLKSDTFMTITPTLKDMLDKMEAKAEDSKDQMLVTSATDLGAFQVKSFDLRTGSNDPRRVWDVTRVVEDPSLRLELLGTALIQKDTRVYRLRNEVVCVAETDAKELAKILSEQSAYTVSRFLDRLLGLQVKLPRRAEDAPPPKGQPKKDQPIGDIMPTDSIISVGQAGKAADFIVDLVLDPGAIGRLTSIAGLAAYALRAEIEAATVGQYYRHSLANAGKTLGEKGLSDRAIAPGQYPPGAFKRPVTTLRYARQPNQRVSWMAGLLPYLEQDRLYGRINFEASWDDPSNWHVGQTLVPHFIDPSYPPRSFFSAHPEMPFEAAVTHYVGIAGVGLDAADYSRTDPQYLTKRGVFGYEKSASLEEIRAGNGASNTILLIQVPHDGIAGPAPWLAGGGATLRGVPETKSIAPFVLTTDRYGRPIQHNGKRGTYVTTVDGSVRWINENISDEVFKAMCTVKGPLPDNFDVDLFEDTPLVPPVKKEGSLPQTPPTKTSGTSPLGRPLPPDNRELAPPPQPVLQSPPATSPPVKGGKGPQ